MFRLGEITIRIPIERHLADLGDRNQFLGNQLRRIENIERERIGFGIAEDLNAEFPLHHATLIERFVHIAAMEIRVLAHQLLRFVPDERIRTEQRFPMELYIFRLLTGVYKTKRVDAEAFHHRKRTRQRPIGHQPHHHVRRFERERNEIPERIVSG